MAKPDLGSKHKCQNCGTKFFDLNKDPITCPKCGTIAQATAAVAAARPAAGNADNDDEEEVEGAEVVSLEDADAGDESKVVTADVDEDVEADDSTSDDDTFLEEEEDDDGDVSDLIDGDIEDDEER